jgi:hypothetical protein
VWDTGDVLNRDLLGIDMGMTRLLRLWVLIALGHICLILVEEVTAASSHGHQEGDI